MGGREQGRGQAKRGIRRGSIEGREEVTDVKFTALSIFKIETSQSTNIHNYKTVH